MTKVRCNNCYKIFDSDDDLTIMKEEPEDYEYFKGCDVCKTDGYLMDITMKARVYKDVEISAIDDDYIENAIKVATDCLSDFEVEILEE